MIKQAGDSVINEAVNVIYTMSKDEKIRETARLREKGRIKDIGKAANDISYREQLFKDSSITETLND